MRRVLFAILLAGMPISCSTKPMSDDEPKPDKFAEDRGRPGEDPKDKRPRFAEDRDPKARPAELDMNYPFDGERCMKYLKQVCDLGPRVSGSVAMGKQQELLKKHFEDHGGKVQLQKFEGKQRSRRNAVDMANMIVTFHPERKLRVLLTAHYDTRPIADQEALVTDWNKPFVSANDGGSGIALFMEIVHHMKLWPEHVGVDFVLFDGEEYVFNADDTYFLGSRTFAKSYAAQKEFNYRSALNFDMVGHPGAKIRIEGYSWTNARELCIEVWGVAEKVGAKSFVYQRGFERAMDVLDDHVTLQEVGIPAIDVIDFDYKHWHKLTDTPDKCDAKQLTEVAKVVVAWVGNIKKP